MQGQTATTRYGVKRKRRVKKLNHTGNLFRKNLQLKIFGSRPKAIGQIRDLYWQRNPKSSCVRKTVNTDILIISRNSDKKSCSLSE